MISNGDAPAYPLISYDSKNPGVSFGLTKREAIAAQMDGFDGEVSASWAAQCLGWENPGKSDDPAYWFNWWNRANAECKKREADALLAALEAGGE